ncbi:hypothetical protein SDRG_11027 [Saprolegnia diclina VS20]|uniref:Uncharacterized protein n=1 Tax=Saprolegnia diclina (strain VS20) TaxID=1156394 RepID=T0RGL6_SAPDV|nr:hypothetical protein SDRG_11027 [Saprolegnia diclina VS20]EQC31428.1 hypothetical protein SDRG_11027 [Saprolegnia diclina VS20]|eukprot:XP_008615269.1 hypothetical protein SDRG_11027 [Saprolegnia diclina VS20]
METDAEPTRPSEEEPLPTIETLSICTEDAPTSEPRTESSDNNDAGPLLYDPKDHPIVEAMLGTVAKDVDNFYLSLDDLNVGVVRHVASALSALAAGVPVTSVRSMRLLSCVLGLETIGAWIPRYGVDCLRPLLKASIRRQRHSLTDAPTQLALILTTFNMTSAVLSVRDALPRPTSPSSAPISSPSLLSSPKKRRRPPTASSPRQPRVPQEGLHVLLAEVMHKYQHRALSRKPQFSVAKGSTNAATAASRRQRSLSYGNTKGKVAAASTAS